MVYTLTKAARQGPLLRTIPITSIRRFTLAPVVANSEGSPVCFPWRAYKICPWWKFLRDGPCFKAGCQRRHVIIRWRGGQEAVSLAHPRKINPWKKTAGLLGVAIVKSHSGDFTSSLGHELGLFQHLRIWLVWDNLTVFVIESVINSHCTQPVDWSEYILGELAWLFLLIFVISCGAHILFLCSVRWWIPKVHGGL